MTDLAQPERLKECELLVAGLVVQAMSERGIEPPAARDLAQDAELRTRDLALLGLSSLDWIALATRLEETIEAELPDEVLVTPESRSVAGWGAAVLAVRLTELPGAGPEPMTPRTQ
ncbi:phosphopantetheine-binding protein [Streptomyces sp. NPDC102406]|uniref:phosphopantetheine-binding protein n=1 Tax=Streptomyces sp. NPDC102406 TaxID=3366171 RepID=UPI00381AB239